MTPTSIKQNKQFVNDEYITQGMIMHESAPLKVK